MVRCGTFERPLESHDQIRAAIQSGCSAIFLIRGVQWGYCEPELTNASYVQDHNFVSDQLGSSAQPEGKVYESDPEVERWYKP